MDFKNWETRKAQLPGRIDRKNFTKTHYYKDGRLLATVHSSGRVELVEIHKLIVDATSVDEGFLKSFTNIKEEIFDELGYVNAQTQTQMKRQLFDKEFRKAAMEKLDIRPDHPKRAILWEMAEQNTGSESMQSLYNEVGRLSQLLS